MLRTVFNGPRPLQPRPAGLRKSLRPVRLYLPLAALFCCATFGANISRAQDDSNQSVADAARHERARKQELRKHSKHVYTEEDLKRQRILTPEDQAVVEARKNDCAQKNNCAAAPSQNDQNALDANTKPQQPSLGDVARQYRKQKELQALKPKQSAPFHLPLSTPAYASPILPEHSGALRRGQPAAGNKTPSHVFRRDPFSAVPVRPSVARGRRTDFQSPASEKTTPAVPGGSRDGVHANSHTNVHAIVREDDREDFRSTLRRNFLAGIGKDVRPTVRPRARLTAPAQPKVFSRPFAPHSLLQPAQPPLFANLALPLVAVEKYRAVEPRRALNNGASLEKTVNVQRGDSLWKLAHQWLGQGSRWRELLAANRWIDNPKMIREGAQLKLPNASPAQTPTRSTRSRNILSIKVQRGDTLWNLAKTSLGSSSYWPCLASANPGILDPNRIYENQILAVPAGCNP
jgi:nucleoid-associated protein YgaU